MMELRELVEATLGNLEANRPFRTADREAAREFLESLECSFKRRGADITPLLGLRTADVVSAWLNVGALEEALRAEGVVSGGGASREKKPSTEEGSEGPRATKPANPAKPSPLVETTAKAWDRLRKALKDLEAMLPEKPPMQGLGLPSLVAPLLEEAEGVLEDAIEFEERKKRKKARREGSNRGNGRSSTASA